MRIRNILLSLSFLVLNNVMFAESLTPILTPADNLKISNQKIQFFHNENSEKNGFSLKFINTGTLTCHDVVIIIKEAYGLIPQDAIFLPYPFSSMPQYTCVKKDSVIALSSAPPLAEGFRPWVDNFDIMLGSTRFSATTITSVSFKQLLVRSAQNAMVLDSGFKGCGLHGTILQRIYDCSKKIINYATYVDPKNTSSDSAITNADGLSDYYTQFQNPKIDNPDLFWFVVACPSANGTEISQQTCAWLTPVVPHDNPAFDTNVTEASVPTFQFAMLKGYQPRLLFSGKMTNDGQGYGFIQANGFLYSTEPEVYIPHYGFSYKTSNEVYALHSSNPGTAPSHGQPTHTSPSVCTANVGENLQTYSYYRTFGTGIFPASDGQIRDVISKTSGASVDWQIPSYPMYNVLAGGTPTMGKGDPLYFPHAACISKNGLEFDASERNNFLGRPYCNTPAVDDSHETQINFGFSAINVPSFAMTHTPAKFEPFLEELWSSSSLGDKYAWAFMGLSQNAAGGFVGGEVHFYPLAVRCVSLEWY